MTTTLDDFETRLLYALREEVCQREPSPAHRPGRRRRYALTAAAVAAATTAFLVLPGIGSTPAYSVQEGNAGEIIVEINAPRDAAGLQRALEEHGIAADITYLPELQTCGPGRYVEVDRPVSGLTTTIGTNYASDLTTTIGTDYVGVTIPPGAVRDGETFVLSWSVLPMTAEELEAISADSEDGTSATEGSHVTIDLGIAAGAVQPCVPVPATQSDK